MTTKIIIEVDEKGEMTSSISGKKTDVICALYITLQECARDKE